MYFMCLGLLNEVSGVFLWSILALIHVYQSYFDKLLVTGLCSGMSSDVEINLSTSIRKITELVVSWESCVYFLHQNNIWDRKFTDGDCEGIFDGYDEGQSEGVIDGYTDGIFVG